MDRSHPTREKESSLPNYCSLFARFNQKTSWTLSYVSNNQLPSYSCCTSSPVRKNSEIPQSKRPEVPSQRSQELCLIAFLHMIQATSSLLGLKPAHIDDRHCLPLTNTEPHGQGHCPQTSFNIVVEETSTLCSSNVAKLPPPSCSRTLRKAGEMSPHLGNDWGLQSVP